MYDTEPSQDFPFHTRHFNDAEAFHVNDFGTLGTAQFGKVLEGKFVNNNGVAEPLAIKHYSLRLLLQNNTYRFTNENPISEIQHLIGIANLAEPAPAGLLRCRRVYRTVSPEPTLHLVTDYVTGGTLHDLLFHLEGVLPNASGIFHQLVDLIAYLHRNGYYHLDISPDNILYCRISHRIYLIDFGSSQHSPDDNIPYIFLGKARYASPEMFRGEQDTLTPSKVDIFALGILFLILHLFQGLAKIERLHHAPHESRSVIYPVIAQGRDVFRASLIGVLNFSNEMAEVCAGMLDINPQNRYSVEDIINSQWWQQTL